MLFSSKDF